MSDKNIRTLFGLKYNPFLPNLPTEAFWASPEAETFAHREPLPIVKTKKMQH